MNIAVGSVVAAATIVPASAAASPTKTPLNVDSARPELRKKWKALQLAYDAFKDAYATHKVAWDLWGQWENANPCPSNHRAYRKWERRSDKYQAEINLDALRYQLDRAERQYHQAQLDLGHERAIDFDKITLKACASMAFEGGVLDGKDSRPTHLKHQQQIVAWSIAMDAVLLSSRSNGEAPARAG